MGKAGCEGACGEKENEELIINYYEQTAICNSLLFRPRGSLSETMEHAITAFDENILSKEILKEVNKDYKTCLNELNSYIKYLKNAKAKNNNQ